jgi:hypothetical protein
LSGGSEFLPFLLEVLPQGKYLTTRYKGTMQLDLGTEGKIK